jgi:hypothetical protein
MSAPRQPVILLWLTLAPALLCAANADDLGRLFTSATERARIDAQHTRAASRSTASPSDAAARVVINGTLRGSDGKRLVWLNGAPVPPDHANAVTLLRDGRVKLSWRDGAKILKPGQGIDSATGEIFEHATPSSAAAVTTPGSAAAKPATAPPAATPKTDPVAPAAETAAAVIKPAAAVAAKVN